MTGPQTRQRPAATGREASQSRFDERKSSSLNGQSSRRPVPPFGAEVEVALAEGRSPNVYVFVGPDALVQACRRQASHGLGSAIFVPPGADPAKYRWPVVPGGVLVVAVGLRREVAFDLARAIVEGGTPMAFVIYADGASLILRDSTWERAA